MEKLRMFHSFRGATKETKTTQRKETQSAARLPPMLAHAVQG